ncbi:MAG: DNA repair ATPase, partial [Bacteroidota bacterium]
METSTYELIRRRLSKHGEELRNRMNLLDQARKETFGAVETRLIATDRITTSNNCLPRDIVAVGDRFIFGYNVHVGLRSEVKLEDVFSLYRFEASDHSFHEEELAMLHHEQFEEDFRNLYKYYKDTVFARFSMLGPHLFMVFQVGKSTRDIKTFKWAVSAAGLTYLGNRFDHEYRYPQQHEFAWQKAGRDQHRRGDHPHVSILDRVFVETIGGDLTVKVEDNTDDGRGIYSEPVDHADQTLDDAEYYYADLGNLILLRIRPYQERDFRYLIFNEKMQEALRVDALSESCIRLPDDQGIIFANGYYLQTGEYKLFEQVPVGLKFERKLPSSNGEDFLFVFHNDEAGLYVLLPYNLVKMQVETPIICGGFTIFPDGELCYFRQEDQPGRHHA